MSKDNGFLPDDPEIGCGYGLFRTKNTNDPFFTPCAYHDFAYGHKNTGRTRKEEDDLLLQRCLEVAGDCTPLKVRAYLYYGLARVGGLFVW